MNFQKGHKSPVGADLSCPPPIYRPMRTPPRTLTTLLNLMIGLDSHPRIFRIHYSAHRIEQPWMKVANKACKKEK